MAFSKRSFLCVVLLTASFAVAQDSSGDTPQLNSTEVSFDVDSSEVLIETTTLTETSNTTATTDGEGQSTSNVTSVCPDGESEIIDVTSCYILCTSQEIFYTSNGVKELGIDCEIREYIEQTNKLIATYGGECDGKGHCVRPDNSTTVVSSSTAGTVLE